MRCFRLSFKQEILTLCQGQKKLEAAFYAPHLPESTNNLSSRYHHFLNFYKLINFRFRSDDFRDLNIWHFTLALDHSVHLFTSVAFGHPKLLKPQNFRFVHWSPGH